MNKIARRCRKCGKTTTKHVIKSIRIGKKDYYETLCRKCYFKKVIKARFGK